MKMKLELKHVAYYLPHKVNVVKNNGIIPLTVETLYYIIQQLLGWRFDIDGLIDKGLAIDINTLDS